jgi:hypothetical protein
MKERELREAATCGVCGQKIGKTGLPMFWRVRIERYAVKLDAVQRQTGLAMMLGGNGVLAAAMGADEDMTAPLMDPVTITVCEDCCTKPVCVAELAETSTSNTEALRSPGRLRAGDKQEPLVGNSGVSP